MKETKKLGALTNLIINIVIPVLIMTKFSKPEYLGPIYGLGIALAFPICFGIWEFIVSKNVNFISIIGFVSILLTGVLGLFQFPPFWIAFKEASVPLIIGLVLIISEYTKYPLTKKLFFNDTLMDTETINNRLLESNSTELFSKLMKTSAYLLSISFLCSSILNYSLAIYIVKSQPGTMEYTQEIGKMTALSFPVIAIPSMILMMIVLFYILNKIKKMTNLELDQILKHK